MSKICADCKHSERADENSVYCYKKNHFFNLNRDGCDDYE